MIRGFSSSQASRALRIFDQPEVASVLRSSVGQTQWVELMKLLEPKLVSQRSRDLLVDIRSFSASPDKLGQDSNIRRRLAAFKAK